jgi:hypothetical protein
MMNFDELLVQLAAGTNLPLLEWLSYFRDGVEARLICTPTLCHVCSLLSSPQGPPLSSAATLLKLGSPGV